MSLKHINNVRTISSEACVNQVLAASFNPTVSPHMCTDALYSSHYGVSSKASRSKHFRRTPPCVRIMIWLGLCHSAHHVRICAISCSTERYQIDTDTFFPTSLIGCVKRSIVSDCVSKNKAMLEWVQASKLKRSHTNKSVVLTFIPCKLEYWQQRGC